MQKQKTLPKQIKFLLFKALVMSHLEYCVAIWGGAFPSVIKQLFSNQKRRSGWLQEQNTTHTQTRFLLQPTTGHLGPVFVLVNVKDERPYRVPAAVQAVNAVKAATSLHCHCPDPQGVGGGEACPGQEGGHRHVIQPP
jgi:hypothetical protein